MKRSILLNSVLTSFLIFSVGSASFLVAGTSFNSNVFEESTVSPVCYISGPNPQYFTTIEKALEVAGSMDGSQTVYVIPGTNPTITRQCVVASNTTLTFPYEGTTYERSDDGDDFLSGFATNNAATYCKNSVTINKVTNLNGEIVPTITINGTVNIGGQRRSTGPQGCTSGNYVEWLVQDDARIDINGNLYMMGFIRETSDNNGSFINVYNTGTITQPMVSYDWGSAGNAAGCVTANIFPFNYFDCPQISTGIYFYSGSKLEASVWMYGNSAGDMKANAYVIGDTSDIALVQSSTDDGSGYIYWKNTDNASGITLTNSTTSHEIELDIYGNYLLSYLAMDLSFDLVLFPIDVNIDSRNYFLPFSNFFNIEILDGGTFNVQYPVKFLPGSKITIDNGGIVNINNNTIVYNSRSGTSGNIYGYSVSTPANLVNNGVLNINAGFGGRINSSDNGNSSTYINVTNISEVTSSDVASYTSGFVENTANPTSFTLSGTADISLEEGGAFEIDKNLESVTRYNFTTNGSDCYWYTEELTELTTVSITPSEGSSNAGESATYTLTANVQPEGVDESTITYNWTVSGNGATLSSNTGKTVTLTTPANDASSEDITYAVKVEATQTKDDGTQISVEDNANFVATHPSGCFAEGTMILLSNGTYKAIEDMTGDEEILTFDHLSGEVVSKPVSAIIKKSYGNHELLTLEFENHKPIDVLYEHGFFDQNLSKYVQINANNVDEYLGHTFISGKGSVKLIDYTLGEKETYIYNIASYENINAYINGMLSISDDIEGFYNVFEYDENGKYIEEYYLDDIEQYGLFEYDELQDYISYDLYNAINAKYLKVAIGKGLITFDDLLIYLEKYGKYFI